MKCQRCVVGIHLGFGDGRGGHTRTAVDISIRYHVQVSRIYFRTGRHSSRLPRAQMICEDLSICMASRTERFRVWALKPQTGSISSSRLFHGPLLSATPRHLSVFCRCAKGGCSPCSHGGHTRYRMMTTLGHLDTFASQDRRTKCMLDLSLNGVTITLFDPRFPARSSQNGGRVGPFPHTVGLLRGCRSPLLFRSGTRPVPCACAKLVIPFLWSSCSPVVIHPHCEDADLHTPLSLPPRSLPAVSSSPDLARLTEDPLSARSSPARTRSHPDTRSLIPHLKLLPLGFNKGYSSLAVNGKHKLCLVRGCLDDCDLFG